MFSLKLKQNKFPVLFITNGLTNKWKPYQDQRCKNSVISTMFSKNSFLDVFISCFILSNFSKYPIYIGHCVACRRVNESKRFDQFH